MRILDVRSKQSKKTLNMDGMRMLILKLKQVRNGTINKLKWQSAIGSVKYKMLVAELANYKFANATNAK